MRKYQINHELKRELEYYSSATVYSDELMFVINPAMRDHFVEGYLGDVDFLGEKDDLHTFRSKQGDLFKVKFIDDDVFVYV
jgi:hypothetical protein